jgi:positive regulator of sigma E activity
MKLMSDQMSDVAENRDALENVDEYRSLSVGAVVVLVLALFSFVALISPLLWFFPVVAIVVGAAVLGSLARHPEKSGRGTVVFAMTLAIFFGSWAPARHFSRQWHLYGEARVMADEWLDLICKKRLRAAHQLHLRPVRRLEAGQSIDDYYESNTMAQNGMRMLYENQPLSVIIAQEEDPTFEFVAPITHRHDGREDSMILRYIVHYEADDQPVDLPIDVVVVCQTQPSGRHDWHIAKAENAES